MAGMYTSSHLILDADDAPSVRFGDHTASLTFDARGPQGMHHFVLSGSNLSDTLRALADRIDAVDAIDDRQDALLTEGV